MRSSPLWALIVSGSVATGTGCPGQAASTPPAQGAHVYVTWDTLEVDSCASAWLIKRFVDPEARFEVLPKGTLVTAGTPFDTPDATYRRRHRLSTYETILQAFHIDDRRAADVGALVHDIEVNRWGEPLFAGALAVEAEVRRVVDTAMTPEEGLAASFAIFDRLAER